MAIYIDKESKTFYLEGENSTYSFFINSFGYPEHLYWGKKIHRDYLLMARSGGARSCEAKVPGTNEGGSTYNHMLPEISYFGTGDYREPTVHPVFEDGSRVTELLYSGYDILPEKPRISSMPSMSGGETLVIYLYDTIRDFGAELYYTAYPDSDVISRRIIYKNESNKKIKLDRAYSFALALPKGDYDALTLFGGWANERNPERTPLHHGVFSIDSKRATSSATLNPFMAVMERGASEDRGNVYGFNLIYSSSYALKAEGASGGHFVVSGGINDFDFSWLLSPGESFETPEAVLSFSAEGLGGMSRSFHRAYREHLINKRYVKALRPVLINNWEATYFEFTFEKLAAIVDSIEGTGIDTFVLDDGWFGKRDDDNSGLGDWVVNEAKLSGGLDRLIDYVHSKGLKFGLWFEPEMISEDSDIFRAHPDYAIGIPDRPRCYSRNQYAMDLTREDVRDYIVDSINAILKKHDIDYVKWDYNRNVTEFFSEGRDPDRQLEFSHRYALGLYDICDRIVLANPDIFFEGCSGGGARFDPAILYYFPQIWTSDDSDAEERTHIQWGTSYAYPLSAMACHVSAVPNHQVRRVTPMRTRADIAHLGATGYELDTTVFTDKDRDEVKRQVAEYHKMEDLVLDGDLYRIEDPTKTNFFSFAIVSPDKSRAHLTCYRSKGQPNPEPHIVKMAGLDENKLYFIPELNLMLHGSTLMNVGFAVNFNKGDFMTRTFNFEEK
ncbi:MAG: alpha-galactosidase [Clostridia bacterium]|nr:alpha-galactosidase [Clostridia bacterium]